MPEIDGAPLKPRPPDLMPSPSVLFDSTTLVTTKVALGGR
jgi:hypothetical protein